MKKTLASVLLIGAFFCSCKKDKTEEIKGIVINDISEGQTNWTKLKCFENVHETEFITNDICFINEKEGYIASDIFRGYNSEGAIYKTIDGGATWQKNYSFGFPGGGSSCTNIFFTSAESGYARSVSASPTFISTMNSGNDWIENDMQTQRNNKACIVGSSNIIVGDLRSVNGSSTWDKIDIPQHVTSCSFYNINVGVCVTSDGLIAKTNDFGQTWDTQYYDKSSSFNSVVMTDSITVIAGGNKMIKSSDCGTTWVEVSKLSGIKEVKFVDKNIGFAAISMFDNVNKRYSGSILKTKDGGTTWQENYHSNLMGFNTLCVINKNTIISGGSASLNDKISGYIIKTTTQGE